MHLDLSDDEAAALTKELADITGFAISRKQILDTAENLIVAGFTA
jgi:hypothetical protein